MNSLFILLLLFGCGNNNSCGCNNCDNTCVDTCNRNSCNNNNSCGCNSCDNNNSCGCNNCDNNNSCDCDNISERFFEGRNDRPCEEKMERRQTRSNFPNFNNRSETCGCEE